MKSTKKAMESATHQSSVSADHQRDRAVKTFNESINTIAKIMTQIDNRDRLHKSISDKINTAYNELSPDNTDSTEIDKLQTLQRNIQVQKQHLRQQIIQHYDNTFRNGKTKTNLIELKIPILIDNMKAYIQSRTTSRIQTSRQIQSS